MKRIIAAAAVLILIGCRPGGEMIGPRTEDAWKEWRKQQEILKETWGDTEVYAYVQTIMTDLKNINANVIFKDDFSVETEIEELDAVRKLHADMGIGEDVSLQEFVARLDDSRLRYAIGGETDLDKIEDKGNGEYEVTLLYDASVDSLMAVTLKILDNGDGTFRTEFQ